MLTDGTTFRVWYQQTYFEVGLLGCSTWLGRRFLNRTFSIQEDDPIVDVDEIRELLDEEIREGDNE